MGKEPLRGQVPASSQFLGLLHLSPSMGCGFYPGLFARLADDPIRDKAIHVLQRRGVRLRRLLQRVVWDSRAGSTNRKRLSRRQLQKDLAGRGKRFRCVGSV